MQSNAYYLVCTYRMACCQEEDVLISADRHLDSTSQGPELAMADV
jgi:hypothetical protein